MINEHDIEDMCPPLTEEDYINDDRAYWIDTELSGIKMQMGFGRYKLGNTKLAEE